jgi:hypothetical protein
VHAHARITITKANRVFREIVRQAATRQYVSALQHGFFAMQHYVSLQCSTESFRADHAKDLEANSC